MINQLNKTIAAQTELIQSLPKPLEEYRLEKEQPILDAFWNWPVSYTHLDVYKRQPIVGMGLLLDANQIPIGMKLYPGNESEKRCV